MRLLLPMLLSLSTAIACDDNTPLCLPGAKLACPYYDGSVGTKTCSADGQSYGECSASTGNGGDGGSGGIEASPENPDPGANTMGGNSAESPPTDIASGAPTG